ncbi:MAG: hypothetical protein V2A34_02455 [Lentisphaerota bacterium]
MKIILKEPDMTEHILANGPERGIGLHIGPSNTSHNSRVLAQINQRLRAGFVDVKNRGNLSTRLSFKIAVEFSNLQDAGTYAIMYPIELPREGNLRLILPLGTTNKVYQMANCVVEEVDPQQMGVTIFINYTIIGGSITWLS